jgi:hypothetical protein
MIDSNRRASEFYNVCRKVEPSIGSDLSTEQQHEALSLQQCGGYDGSLNTQRVDTCFQPTAGATPPKRPGGPWNARPQTGNPRWDQGLGGKKCGACLHVATLPATDWVLIGSVNPTSPGGRRPSACRTAGSSVAARTPSSSLLAIRGQRATTGLINQTRPSRRLKATFRDGHHILWCHAVLILTRNLGGSNAKTVSFWICRRSNRVGHDCLGLCPPGVAPRSSTGRMAL